MKRVQYLLTVTGLALSISGALLGQDKTQEDTLPQNWKKLSLSDEQKQKIYSIQGEYKTKIEELLKQIDDLKTKRRSAMEAVLTNTQKAKLKEIASEKALEKVGDDKNPDKKAKETKKP